MTYAFTGCSGPIPVPGPTGQTDPTGSHTLQWADLPDLGGPSLSVPIRHAAWQLVPETWTATVEEAEWLGEERPILPRSYTEDLAVARQLPWWREPTLPTGWRFRFAIVAHEITPSGYTAKYVSPAGGNYGLAIRISFATLRGYPTWAAWRPNGTDLGVRMTRLIAGRPAMILHSGPGTNDPYFLTAVSIYDPDTEVVYELFAEHLDLLGANIGTLIRIARSLFEPPNAP